jgi:hypothetical protein
VIKKKKEKDTLRVLFSEVVIFYSGEFSFRISLQQLLTHLSGKGTGN